MKFRFLRPRLLVENVNFISFRMQSSLKKEITNWERLGKRYHKDSMKIFRNIKIQLEKKAPNREDLNKFG